MKSILIIVDPDVLKTHHLNAMLGAGLSVFAWEPPDSINLLMEGTQQILKPERRWDLIIFCVSTYAVVGMDSVNMWLSLLPAKKLAIVDASDSKVKADEILLSPIMPTDLVNTAKKLLELN